MLSNDCEISQNCSKELVALAQVVVASPVPWNSVLQTLRGKNTETLKQAFFEQVLPACFSSLFGRLPTSHGKLDEQLFFARVRANQEKKLKTNCGCRRFAAGEKERKMLFFWVWNGLKKRLDVASVVGNPEDLERIFAKSGL